MASGREYTHHQRKIINRYYEHLDTISLTKLGELVSELYLCAGDNKKSAALWTRVEKALVKAEAGDVRVRRVLESKDVKALAALVNDLARST
ncbi:MAG TPA: hypothetical protein DEB06_08720 [Phycisphaerales bacterium]|nr:hypothetical protein [Phycisphaerales bacterium]